MAAMDRYFIPDDYTRLELELRYQSSDAKGRISLLQELSQRNSLSYEITLWAVQDSDPMVRQWIARHGNNLRYAWHFHRSKEGWVNDEPEPSLYDSLKADPSLLVRASLRENPSATGVVLKDEFLEATQLERLALMRNPEMKYPSGRTLLERIFDGEDTELNISFPEREDLILAFLTNAEVLQYLEKEAGLTEAPQAVVRYRPDLDSANSFLNRLWELAAKWPSDRLPAPVPELTFRQVSVKDETRAKIYRYCNVPTLRRAILESLSERDTETLKLGVRDEDDNCKDNLRGQK